MEDLGRKNGCLLDEPGPDALVLEISNPRTTITGTEQGQQEHASSGRTYQASRRVSAGQKGLFVLYYCACPGEADAAASEVEVGVAGRGAAAEGDGGGGGGGRRSHVTAGIGEGKGRHLSSFRLRVVFWNEGAGGAPDYLSAGSEVLPTLFFSMFLLFLVALVVWVQCIRRNPAQVRGMGEWG